MKNATAAMRVHTALNKWQERTFSYGDSDCCQFTAFIVRELTGKDYTKGFAYDSEAQAHLIVERSGDLIDFLSDILGSPSADIKDGDPCVVEVPTIGQICGVALSGSVVCLTTNGMLPVPSRYVKASWAVEGMR